MLVSSVFGVASVAIAILFAARSSSELSLSINYIWFFCFIQTTIEFVYVLMNNPKLVFPKTLISIIVYCILSAADHQFRSPYILPLIVSLLATTSLITPLKSTFAGIFASLTLLVLASNKIDPNNTKAIIGLCITVISIATIPFLSSLLMAEFLRLVHLVRLKEHLAAAGQLASGIAHEIRNPLAGISGSFQIIKSELPQDNPQTSQLVNVIDREIQRLEDLTNDFLDFSKNITVSKEKVNIVEILNESILVVKNGFGQRKIQINYDVKSAITILGDKNRLKQVFINLVKNSFQAAQELTTVQVTDSPESVSIHFCDDGKGISPDSSDKIFTPFFSKKTGGTGLGLAISKKIIDLHGGVMEAKNRVNDHGAIFTIILPRVQ